MEGGWKLELEPCVLCGAEASPLQLSPSPSSMWFLPHASVAATTSLCYLLPRAVQQGEGELLEGSG